MKRTHTILGVVAGILCTLSSAYSQGTWTLIDRHLRESHVELSQIDNNMVEFIDADGRTNRHPIANYIAVLHERPPKTRPSREMPWITRQLELFGQNTPATTQHQTPPTGMLTLTDGQQWSGVLAGTHGDSISWLLEGSAVLDTTLDRLRTAGFLAPIEARQFSWDGLNDRVLMLNGDYLDGYVASIESEIQIETDLGNLSLPLDRIKGILLANTPTSPEGIMIRTDAGSAIATSNIDISITGQVHAAVPGSPANGSIILRTSDLRSILFAPNDFVGLASIKPSLAEPLLSQIHVYGAEAPADDPLGIDSLVLQGPIHIEWDLSRPAARFSATATLPPAMWAWGDCEIVVLNAKGDEAFRERLHAGHPCSMINIPLDGQKKLTLEIISQRGGHVQDRIILSRPLISWQTTEP